ncbi:MAG: DnaJ domain-containing protein [Phycisphaerales bacterium JB038]
MSDSTAEDAFALLGLPRRFEVAEADIERAYLARAAALHPDRFQDPVEQAEAVRRAARVNDARKLLLDREQRAIHLLRLLIGGADESSEALPDGFLMEVLEIREEMEADDGDPSRRAHWDEWAREQRAEYLARIGALFAGAADDSLNAEAAASIRLELNALRYIERMIEQLHSD